MTAMGLATEVVAVGCSLQGGQCLLSQRPPSITSRTAISNITLPEINYDHYSVPRNYLSEKKNASAGAGWGGNGPPPFFEI